MTLLDVGGVNILGNYSRFDRNRINVSSDDSSNSRSFNRSRGHQKNGHDRKHGGPKHDCKD